MGWRSRLADLAAIMLFAAVYGLGLCIVAGCGGRLFNAASRKAEALVGGDANAAAIATSPLGWTSALAILAGIVCVFLHWHRQAVALIGTGAGLIVLNLTLQTHQTLVALTSLVVGVAAVVLVGGQYIGLWTFKKKLAQEAAHPDWTEHQRNTILEALAEVKR